MKSWGDFFIEKTNESSAMDVGAAALSGASLSGSEEDTISTMYKIANLAWDNHRSRTLSFFHSLAADDDNIKSLLEKIDDDKSRLSSATRKAANLQMDDDEVAPLDADNGGGGGGDGEWD